MSKPSSTITTEAKEMVNHPKHYNLYPIEVIDMMVAIWGIKATIDFCYMNAFKYRMRLGMKDSIEQDTKKELWYLDKAKELESKVSNEPTVSVGFTLPGIKEIKMMMDGDKLSKGAKP